MSIEFCIPTASYIVNTIFYLLTLTYNKNALWTRQPILCIHIYSSLLIWSLSQTHQLVPLPIEPRRQSPSNVMPCSIMISFKFSLLFYSNWIPAMMATSESKQDFPTADALFDKEIDNDNIGKVRVKGHWKNQCFEHFRASDQFIVMVYLPRFSVTGSLFRLVLLKPPCWRWARLSVRTEWIQRHGWSAKVRAVHGIHT